MNLFLLSAAVLASLGGIVHLWAGEQLIFKKLEHQNLPELRGSTELTWRMLRVFWHVASFTWWGLAIQLVILARQGVSDPILFQIGVVLALVFLTTGAYSMAATRARFRPSAVILIVAILIVLGLR